MPGPKGLLGNERGRPLAMAGILRHAGLRGTHQWLRPPLNGAGKSDDLVAPVRYLVRHT
jgi:hypothetical protein